MKVKIRIPKNGEQEFGQLPLLVFIIIAFAIFLTLCFLSKDKAQAEERIIEEPPKNDIGETPPPLKETKEMIRKGETLSDILSRHGFSPAEIHKLRAEVKPVYDLAKIKEGREIRLYKNQQETITTIEYDINKDNYLHIQKIGGTYEATEYELPYETEIHMIWGTIENNLPNAITREGEKGALAYDLSEIFAWDVDFYIDLRKGDSFKILFEKKYLKGKFVGYGSVLAATFTNRGTTYQAFRFTYPDTKETDYFNEEGESLRREFLKSPFKYTPRITSRFSYNRLHPVRKVYRPHYGVDYAAKVGTPVHSTADGTVLFAGWNGASGRMIRIRHKNNYETMYLHLRRCYVKKGVRVTGGQRIGEVGASGEVSGPHLDYRIKYGGKYINPLAHRFKPVKPLRSEFLESFMLAAQNYSLYFHAPLIIFSSF
ncbi:MAG: peptidoglycan DD-metalloendopeptidase family protein [Candidatus Aminicenantes bacterium]|nr:MAG: peptidoglycan DD-metalloendopeptidase family protein [Candidatus Aminicenantes bacterium]